MGGDEHLFPKRRASKIYEVYVSLCTVYLSQQMNPQKTRTCIQTPIQVKLELEFNFNFAPGILSIGLPGFCELTIREARVAVSPRLEDERVRRPPDGRSHRWRKRKLASEQQRPADRGFRNKVDDHTHKHDEHVDTKTPVQYKTDDTNKTHVQSEKKRSTICSSSMSTLYFFSIDKMFFCCLDTSPPLVSPSKF